MRCPHPPGRAGAAGRSCASRSSVSDMGWRPRARGGPPSTDRLLSGLVPASQARDTVLSVAVLGRGLSRMPRPLLKSTLRFTETAP